MDQPRLSRRAVLGGAGAVVASGTLPAGLSGGLSAGLSAELSAELSAGVSAGIPIPLGLASGAPEAKKALRPVSMAMHIHGPFSEGLASYAAHLAQARRYEVDVVWWTDHDFRIAAFEHRQAVHFDGASEPEGGLAWTWTQEVEGTPSVATAEFVDSPRSARDRAGTALRLVAEGDGTLLYRGNAWNDLANACIADTQLTLDVLPEQLPADGLLVFDVRLSHQPFAAGVLSLRYKIGNFKAVEYAVSGTSGTVSLPVRASGWQQLTFTPRDDVARLWPDVVAGDNALTGLAIGVRGARFVVDRLTFNRSRRAGQDSEQLRAEVIAAVGERYPDVAHYRAMEVSLVRHLNWFGGDLTFPVFPSPPKRDNDAKLTESMVRWLKSHGGLVCWNHPMDVATRTELAALIVQRAALGVDLVEIGRKPLEDLLWVFDVAARNAVFFTAVGSSDDHDALDWALWEEHNLTSVWAASTSRADLLAALRAGAAWFTDLMRYRGALDLRIGGVSYMGAVLVSTKSVRVQLVATKLPEDAKLEIVTGVVDGGGLTPSTKISSGKTKITLTPGHYVRTQVRMPDGTVVGASNPLWLLAKAPARPIPPSRKRALPKVS